MLNHSSFRFWIKDLDNNIIQDTFKMNPAKFKAVAYTVSLYGDYKERNNIKMSWKTIASESGVDRKTALKARDVLVHNGLLIETEKLESNISVYRLGAVGDSEDLSCPFWWSQNGPNSITYLDSVNINDDDFQSSSLEDLENKDNQRKLTNEELYEEWLNEPFSGDLVKESLPPHPADITPKDYEVGIQAW